MGIVLTAVFPAMCFALKVAEQIVSVPVPEHVWALATPYAEVSAAGFILPGGHL